MLHCFGGCAFVDIVAALGIRASDCFISSSPAQPLTRVERFASRETIIAFLKRETLHQRDLRVGRDPIDTPRIRAADVNHARVRAATIYRVSLAPIAAFAWEGWHPHDTDPAWPELFERACEEIAHERYHFMNPSASAWVTQPITHALIPTAADRAALWLHDLMTT